MSEYRKFDRYEAQFPEQIRCPGKIARRDVAFGRTLLALIIGTGLAICIAMFALAFIDWVVGFIAGALPALPISAEAQAY